MQASSKPPSPYPAAFRRRFDLGHLLLGWRDDGTRAPRPIGFHDPRSRPIGRAPLQPVWQESREGHGLVVAPTGAGKSVSSLVPHLLTWPGPAVVVDPKGELAAVTSRYRRETLGQRVVLLDPFHCFTKTPDCLNPLDAIRFSDGTPEEFATAALALLHPNGPAPGVGSTDHAHAYWQEQGDALLGAVLLHLLTSPTEEKTRTLPRLWDFLMAEDTVYSLALLLDQQGKNMPRMAHGQIANFLSTTDVTRSGILSTAQQSLRLLADPSVVAALGSTSFDLEAFQRGEPLTIYLILPPTRLVSHGMLLRSWLATLFNVVMLRERIPQMPTLFLVDEVAALGPMDPLRTAFTLLRGYGIRVFLYLQCLSQLKRLYPQDWDAFVNNAGTIQAFGVGNHLMARQLSEIFGKVTPEEFLNHGSSDQQHVLFHGGQTERCRKLDYRKDRCFRGRFDQNPRYAVAR